jgi:hypothetical protein
MRIARIGSIGAALCLTLLAVPAAHAAGAGDDQHAQHGANQPAALVNAVRSATRQFLDVSNTEGEYSPFLGCVSGTQEGAMGLHYVNGPQVDGQLEVDRPEALMYEMRNGRLYLLGVEYIVIADAWDTDNPLPPALLGQVFTYNTSPNRFGLPPFYALHVWAWRDNPHGTFVDWNPQVSCDGFSANP